MGRGGKDGRAGRPAPTMTAVLYVDGQALPYWKQYFHVEPGCLWNEQASSEQPGHS